MDSQVRCMGAHPLYRPLSQRGLLDPINSVIFVNENENENGEKENNEFVNEN